MLNKTQRLEKYIEKRDNDYVALMIQYEKLERNFELLAKYRMTEFLEMMQELSTKAVENRNSKR